MRNDHHAYQRAARVAGFGLLLQLLIGLTLLLFGLLSVPETDSGFRFDRTFVFGAIYVFLGAPVWLSLIIVFYQHKLERLEALEQDELAAGRSRGESGSMFDEAEEETRVAARRLRIMYRWLMPAVSLALVAAMGLLGWWMIDRLQGVPEQYTFDRTPFRGWAVSICLAIAVASFIFSRFVAGMAKVETWQNLRGGAGYMVGNALVALAIAVGTAFRFFDNDQVIFYIAFAIPIFMLVIAAEIVLNFILNIYRPRVVGETPRPAFDSRLLSLVSTPDSIVRTINEAVNYQFGFDITSSWGYQLLLRSFAWLIAIAVIVLIALNMFVVVEPYQQAVKLAGGAIVGDEVHDSGIMWKLPWPFQTAEVYDVTRVRELPLTAQQRFGEYDVSVWENELQTDVELDPFIVSASQIELTPELSAQIEDVDLPAELTSEEIAAGEAASEGESGDEAEVSQQVVRNFALAEAIISMHYRIKSTKTGSDTNGLLDYLRFAPDIRRPREELTDREKALKDLALREISIYLTRVPLNALLSGTEQARGGLVERLRRRVQGAFDEHHTGVEVVALVIPELRPAGGLAANYVDLTIAKQQRRERISQAEQRRISTLTYRAGSTEAAEEVIRGIDRYDELKRELGPDHPDTIAQRLEVESMLEARGGAAITEIIKAERDRWVQVMAERARVSRVIGELPVYLAAPDLYREREIMAVFKKNLDGVRKLIVGIDPSRFDVEVDTKELGVPFGIADQNPDSE